MLRGLKNIILSLSFSLKDPGYAAISFSLSEKIGPDHAVLLHTNIMLCEV